MIGRKGIEKWSQILIPIKMGVVIKMRRNYDAEMGNNYPETECDFSETACDFSETACDFSETACN